MTTVSLVSKGIKGNKIAAALVVPFCEVYWHKPNNICRSEEASNLGNLTYDLALGWKITEGAIPVVAIPDSEREACLSERGQRWEELKSPGHEVELAVFEQLFTRGGKLVEPCYSGRACFQRGSVYFQAMVLRRKGAHVRNEKSDPEEVIHDVPVALREYANESEMLFEQVFENVGKERSTSKISDRDKLRTAYIFFGLGKNQTFLRQLYTDTMGQKLYHFLLLNVRYPDLKLYERALLTPDAPEAINLKKLRHNELGSLNGRYVESKNGHRKLKPGQTPLTRQEVEQHINDRLSGGSNAPKSMTRANMEALAEQNEVKVIQRALSVVLDDDTDVIAKDSLHVAAYNTVTDAIDNGVGPEMERILVALLPEVMRDAKRTIECLRAAGFSL